jgi:hypothetical protein
MAAAPPAAAAAAAPSWGNGVAAAATTARPPGIGGSWANIAKSTNPLLQASKGGFWYSVVVRCARWWCLAACFVTSAAATPQGAACIKGAGAVEKLTDARPGLWRRGSSPDPTNPTPPQNGRYTPVKVLLTLYVCIQIVGEIFVHQHRPNKAADLCASA